MSSRESAADSLRRQQRTTAAQNYYRQQKQQEREAEVWQQRWLAEVYAPINRLVNWILNPLEEEIEQLSGDPFDDQLMAVFQDYLANCRQYLERARQTLSSQPNPAQFAQVAVRLYYSLNQIADGIEELERFTLNYDDYYLHTGTELLRIARGLSYEAQEVAKFSIITVPLN